MIKTDIVVCQYLKGNIYNCGDYWSETSSAHSLDSILGGVNDVSLVEGKISTLDSSMSPYITLVEISFKKDPDKFDWSGFSTLKTRNGSMSGVVRKNYVDGV
jgi:hypothetical protein